MSNTGHRKFLQALQTKFRLQSREAFTKSPLEDFLLPVVPQEDSEDDIGGGQNVTNCKRGGGVRV